MDGYWRKAKMRSFTMKTRLFQQCYVPDVHFSGFNVGLDLDERFSPEGTAETCVCLSRPFGTNPGFDRRFPNVETLGYCHESLRDRAARAPITAAAHFAGS